MRRCIIMNYQIKIPNDPKAYDNTNNFHALVFSSYQPGNVDQFIQSVAKSKDEQNMLYGEEAFMRMDFSVAEKYLRYSKESQDIRIRSFSLMLLCVSLAARGMAHEFMTEKRILENIEDVPIEDGGLIVLASKAVLYNTIFATEEYREIVEFLHSLDTSMLDPRLRMYFIFIYTKLLIHTGRFTELEYTIQTAMRLYDFSQYPLMGSAMYFYLASALTFRNELEDVDKLIEKGCILLQPDSFKYSFSLLSTFWSEQHMNIVEKYWPECGNMLRLCWKDHTQNLISAYDRASAGSGTANLTRREYEVAVLAAYGLSNKEIATKLTISESTVKAFLRYVYNKLMISSRRELSQRLLPFL